MRWSRTRLRGIGSRHRGGDEQAAPARCRLRRDRNHPHHPLITYRPPPPEGHSLDSQRQTPPDFPSPPSDLPRAPPESRGTPLCSRKSWSGFPESRRVRAIPRRISARSDHPPANPVGFLSRRDGFPGESVRSAGIPDRIPVKSVGFSKNLIRFPEFPSGFCQRQPPSAFRYQHIPMAGA